MSIKKAIYFVAYDYPFTQMASLALRSLRTRGKFQGTVVIFTNANGDNRRQMEPYAEVVYHSKSKIIPKAMKFKSPKYFNFKPYDCIMYLDCDMLVLRSLNSLFRLVTDRNVVCRSASDGGSMLDNKTCCWRFRDDNEKQKARSRPCVNSGFFCVGNWTFHEICRRWDKRINIRSCMPPKGIYDQPAFNCVLTRYNYDIEYVSPRKIVYAGDKMGSSAILCHFEHGQKLKRMNEFLKSLSDFESPEAAFQQAH